MSELLQGHRGRGVWIDQSQELSFLEVSADHHSGKLNYGFVHEVKLRHSEQFSDEAAVLQIAFVARVKHLANDLKLGRTHLDT